jgi:hypothetical protein
VFAHVVDVERGRCLFIQQWAQLAVAVRVELEVVRPNRLALSDDGDELILVHRRQCIVGPTLLAYRRTRLARQLLATGRSRAVRWKHACRIWQSQQFVVQRSIQLAGECVGRQA